MPAEISEVDFATGLAPLFVIVWIASSTILYGSEPYFQINLNGARTKFTSGLIFLSFLPRLIEPSSFVAVFAIFLYFSASVSNPFSFNTFVIWSNWVLEIL